MKLVSTTLCVTLGTACLVFAADEPKPAARRTTRAAPQYEKPRILTLETPANPGVPKAPDPSASNPTLQLAPADPLIITPAIPPGTPLLPDGKENTGPTLTVNDKNAPLVPGIYIASPYRGIVVVPAPTDAGIFRPEPPNASKIPIAAPDLKFTPKTK